MLYSQIYIFFQKPYLPTMPIHKEEETVDDLMGVYYSELIKLSVL